MLGCGLVRPTVRPAGDPVRIKCLSETGKPLQIAMAPPPGFMEAVKQAVPEKPWAKGGA